MRGVGVTPGWRRSHVAVVVAAVAAVVLATYDPHAGRERDHAAATDDTLGPPEATAPTIDGLLAADVDLDDLAPPQLPDADEGAVTPFRSSAAPGVGEDERVAADLVVEAPDGEALDLVVEAPDGEALELDGLADHLDTARHVAAAAALSATLVPEDTTTSDEVDIDVLGIDAGTFRPLTPDVTASADPLWDRFADGDVLVTHELAERLDLELGGRVALAAGGTTVPVRIGAFAVNGDPPFADVLVPTEVTTELGGSAPNRLVVSATEDVEELGDRLAEVTGGQVELRRPPAAPVADHETTEVTEGTASGAIEPFSYTSRADGRITIHGGWVERNIVRVELPGMASSQCHRLMVPQLYAAVDELIEHGLYDHLDPAQFAGCFVARHIDWDPRKPLSMHAWGLAIDVNAKDNPLGATPVMDRRVVEVFERWGFAWGGHWSRPDGMHFELERVVPTG